MVLARLLAKPLDRAVDMLYSGFHLIIAFTRFILMVR